MRVGHVDDDILTGRHLENGLDAVLAEAECEMGRFLMEGCAGCSGIYFSHKIV